MRGASHIAAALALAVLSIAAPARADEDPPARDGEAAVEPAEPVATVQRRFAPKLNTVSLHVLGAAQFRGDFYHHLGYGAALAYYPWEELGLELRAIGHYAWLTAEAEQVRRDTGLIPDTRAPVATFLLGARYSFGYGKVQIGDAFIVHFDPQAVLHAGATIAEEDRVLPTALLGLSFLLHFELGFQAQIELCAVIDLEERNERGWVASVGFAPFLSIGWRLDPEMLR